MGFSRLSCEEKVKLMPLILSCVEICPSNHQLTLLTMFVSVFSDTVVSHTKTGGVGISKEPSSPKGLASLLDPCTVIKGDVTKSHPKSFNTLLQFLMEIILWPYSRHQESSTPAPNNDQSEGQTAVQVPGGFSQTSFKNLSYHLDDTFIGLKLEKVGFFF